MEPAGSTGTYTKRNWKRRNEMEHTIEIPADVKTVTLELKKREEF